MSFRGIRPTTLAAGAIVLAIGGFWAGCGDNEGNQESALFSGDVSSVSGGTAARPQAPRLAERLFAFPAPAWAQSSCAAPGGGALLFCVDDACAFVDPGDCDFRRTVPIPGGGPITAALRFVDDEDGDGFADASELDSVVAQNLRFCAGDEVRVAGAAIDFTAGVTTASVTKTVDECPPSATATPTRTAGPRNTERPRPTSTPGGSGTATATPNMPGQTPTRTRTPTRTPTTSYYYASGATAGRAPTASFAFLASLGIIGLLIPRRRKDD